MDRTEFIEKFATSRYIAKRNEKARRTSQGMIKFKYLRGISFENDGKDYSIDLCEICIHPKGKTMNIFKMCTSFDGVDIIKLVKDLKICSKIYFNREVEPGEHGYYLPNLVIPPDPAMIMELGNHIKEIEGIAVNIYDPQKDRRGAFLIDEDFFAPLRRDPDTEGLDNAGIFTNFMMDFIETL